MRIHEMMIWGGEELPVVYHDADDFSSLPLEQCRQVYGVCFYQGKIILGRRNKNNQWGIIGGTIESGETFVQTLHREIQEESNTMVVAEVPIGYQVASFPERDVYQLRYAAVVRPLGPFKRDPDGSIDEVIFIQPEMYRQYFDWGKIGDRIIQRSQEIYHTKLFSYDRPTFS